jgi:hypothetical protein
MKMLIFLPALSIAASALIALLPFTPLSYLYCVAREDSWLKAKTEQELEQRLFVFYSKKQIQPLESGWGAAHLMREGERMTRYMILGDCPLDVVYANDGAIAAIYTSYE